MIESSARPLAANIIPTMPLLVGWVDSPLLGWKRMSKRKWLASSQKGSGPYSWLCLPNRFQPKRPAAFYQRPTPSLIRSQTFRIRCCCSLHSHREGQTFCAERSTTESISLTARHCVLYCQPCRNSSARKKYLALRSAVPGHRFLFSSNQKHRKRKRRLALPITCAKTSSPGN